MSKKADDVITNAVISCIHKGKWGSGKSIASCSKALRPTYVLDCEDRMNSVINYYRKLDGNVKGLEFDTFAMGDGFFKVKKQLDALESSAGQFKTVVCATLTSYVDIVLEGLRNKGGTRASGGEAGKKIGGIAVNELEDFNGETAAIAFELIRTLKRLQTRGVNIILEAHVMQYEFKDKAGNTHHERSLLTGGKKAAAKVPGYFNEIFHFEVDSDYTSTKYIAHTVATSEDFAKTSFPQLPSKIDWTGKDFYEEVFKYLPKEIKDAPRVDPNRPKEW